ncbi:hypothetical protein O6H91_02G062400 [Diphasiastrum complanatum]|uniref:Uncharacterized protein n=1 Tax=Diphasiastrum complanatum TaxID=34168 RepID=A0ACC2EG57_DIPCM|nr:hypothetical protein O6H91_02G062400 [Diphasiastrum complanatum]
MMLHSIFVLDWWLLTSQLDAICLSHAQYMRHNLDKVFIGSAVVIIKIGWLLSGHFDNSLYSSFNKWLHVLFIHIISPSQSVNQS